MATKTMLNQSGSSTLVALLPDPCAVVGRGLWVMATRSRMVTDGITPTCPKCLVERNVAPDPRRAQIRAIGGLPTLGQRMPSSGVAKHMLLHRLTYFIEGLMAAMIANSSAASVMEQPCRIRARLTGPHARPDRAQNVPLGKAPDNRPQPARW